MDRLDVDGRFWESDSLHSQKPFLDRALVRGAQDMLKEMFTLFVRSSFSRRTRTKLFEYVWHAFGGRISFYISNFIPRSHPGFEDVFQDVMLKIFENLHTFSPDRSFKAWTYTIARNKCLDFLKNKEERIAAMKSGDASAAAAPAQRNPENRMLHRELAGMIDGVLDNLSETDREISYLFFYENMRCREIAIVVGMNVNTVKSRLRAIRAVIKKRLRGAI